MTRLVEPDVTGRNDGGTETAEVKAWSGRTVRRRLSIYGPEDALMIGRIELFGSKHAEASFIADGSPVRPILEGRFSTDISGRRRYIVTQGDVKGHFDPNSGTDKSPAPPSLLPGVKIAAVSRVVVDEQVGREGSRARLSRIHGVHFINPAGVGAILSPGISRKDFLKDGTRRYTAFVSSGEQEIAKLHLDYHDNAPFHDPNKHIDALYSSEIAAQAALLVMQERDGLESMDGILPVYKGIEEINILRQIEIGEKVKVEVFLMDPKEDPVTKIKPSFEANAIIYKEDGSIAQVVRGMTGFVGSRRAMNRNIRDRMKNNLLAEAA